MGYTPISIHQTVGNIGNQRTGREGQHGKTVFVHHNTEWKNNQKIRKEKKFDCSCQSAVLDFVLWIPRSAAIVESLPQFCSIITYSTRFLPGCLKAASWIWEISIHKSMMGTSLWKRVVQNKGRKFEERGLGRVNKEEPWRPPRGACMCRGYHTAAVCLMLWKLIRVGEVGMDIARATRTRREWWSCQRCHLFLAAERTWWEKNWRSWTLGILRCPL